MWLNHDLYFFWVSSLAYPNLFGKKGYVVVVVVVVVVVSSQIKLLLQTRMSSSLLPRPT